VRPAAEALPVRADSHRLTSPDRSELIVEFKALVEDRLAD
jgi:hypothetical protein